MSLADLQAPANVPEHVVTAVQTQLEFLAPKCGLAVTSVIGREASLRVAAVEATSHGDVTGDYAWFRVGNAGHRCAALMMRDAEVARLAELFMGGDAKGTDRVPTMLESSIVERRLGSLLTGLDDVLAVFGVEGHSVSPVAASEFNLEPHQIRATLEVAIGDAAIPITLVLPAAHHAVRADTAAALDTSSVFAEALGDVPVSVSIRFEAVSMSANELDDLEPGDVIRLDQPENAAIVGLVDGIRVFSGHAGRHGRHLAVEIFEVSQ
jgi:flagellar motor switch protein FliM